MAPNFIVVGNMIHPQTELCFISKEIGYGVVATRLIPKGTITWAYDLFDQSFSPQQVDVMDKVYKDILDVYSYRNGEGHFILCWDNSRFINHSFNSSCISTAYNFELAIRDIHPGEELTDDYGYLNCMKPFDCMPEPLTSRTRVMPDDLFHFYKEWDRKLISAFESFNQVEQPLLFLIEPEFREKVNDVAGSRKEMDSILNTFYSDDPDLMVKKKTLLRSYNSQKVMESISL